MERSRGGCGARRRLRGWVEVEGRGSGGESSERRLGYGRGLVGRGADAELRCYRDCEKDLSLSRPSSWAMWAVATWVSQESIDFFGTSVYSVTQYVLPN